MDSTTKERLGKAASRTRWYRRPWLIATITGLVGLGIGSATAGSTDVEKSSAYKAVAAARDRSEAQATDLRTRLTAAEGDIPAREAAVHAAEARVRTRQQNVARRERSVARRERAVGIVERRIKRNTISGDGVYAVGQDIKPGTYKTNGANGCYYAILNSTDTFDIADNNNINGPAIVTLASGKYFETTRCADWVWQR